MTQFVVNELVKKYSERIKENRNEDYLPDTLNSFAEEIMEMCGEPVPKKSKFMEEWEETHIKSELISDDIERDRWLMTQLIKLIDKHKMDKEAK